ncbi:MAG: PEP-CTERM sorting domain-containing protein [Cyanobacteria bacterium P01_E01_bin.42]
MGIKFFKQICSAILVAFVSSSALSATAATIKYKLESDPDDLEGGYFNAGFVKYDDSTTFTFGGWKIAEIVDLLFVNPETNNEHELLEGFRYYVRLDEDNNNLSNIFSISTPCQLRPDIISVLGTHCFNSASFVGVDDYYDGYHSDDLTIFRLSDESGDFYSSTIGDLDGGDGSLRYTRVSTPEPSSLLGLLSLFAVVSLRNRRNQRF